jgi:hypothetical protein
MSGFGSQPFGGTPYGIGQPADVDPNGGTVLKDAYANKSHGSRRIDPVTKDYVLNEFGRIVGMDNVQQQVLLAVSMDRGSSSVRDLGNELKKIDRITDNFEHRVDSVIRSALSALVDSKQIEVQSITTTRLGNGRAFIKVAWRDLTTGNEFVEEVSK